MAVADAVPDVERNRGGVDLDDVQGAARAARMQGMLMEWSPPGRRGRPGGEDGADAGFDVGVGGFGVGVDDCRHRRCRGSHAIQVSDVVFVVIGPGVAEGKEGGGLTDATRAEAGPGAEMGDEKSKGAPRMAKSASILDQSGW